MWIDMMVNKMSGSEKVLCVLCDVSLPEIYLDDESLPRNSYAISFIMTKSEGTSLKLIQTEEEVIELPKEEKQILPQKKPIVTGVDADINKAVENNILPAKKPETIQTKAVSNWKDNKVIQNIIKENLKNGDIQIIVGTHALIQEDVIFNNLGLTIIDEQHKFGVEQRKK